MVLEGKRFKQRLPGEAGSDPECLDPLENVASFSVVPRCLRYEDVSATKVCSEQDVVDHLNLTSNRDRLTLTRPVQDWTTPTVVSLDVFIYTILSVFWENELISWDPADFCGIQEVTIPRELLWKPDLIIYETMEKNEASGSPYLMVRHDGRVIMDNNLKLVSTCSIDIHKFPFDTQNCNLTFSSSIYTDQEIQLVPLSNSSLVTKNSREIMLTHGEWEFMNVSVHTVKVAYQDQGTWDQVVYTITIRRVPLLQVLTFIMPILFFLSLDLASFFMPDTRGDKLCFKVTVLLAMSVLLLILNDTFPSKPSKTPLMAVYVIVVFAFMLLSLLETILVVYLMERASTPRGSRAGRGSRGSRAPSSEGLHLSRDAGMHHITSHHIINHCTYTEKWTDLRQTQTDTNTGTKTDSDTAKHVEPNNSMG
ncbi:5-hydroxytryptamine receptor 3A-like [Clupea harengus]|uniref:5-hydroxytryptamine receptor 3A-like n=1 Tax=Clupea harengus TaxID=7950 RepID=A0A6P8FD48_CLUHA|nr:5-hydroxytryptamine receptor 3A-like [Clupea harengus]